MLKSALLLLLLLFTVSCNTEPEFENHLIGTWKNINYQTDDWEKIIFNENLSYELQNYSTAYDQTVRYSGSYTYTDTTFSLRQYNTSTNYSFLYAIINDRLYVYNGKIYTKQ